LTAVKGFLGCISAGAYGDVSNEMTKRVQIADRNICRLITLTNNLLDTEKADAGKLTILCENAPIADIIHESISMLEPLFGNVDIKLQLDRSRTEVHVDKERMIQVVVNLLSNALKYSPANSTITVRTALAGNELVCSIIDEGRGIPADELEHIFDRFRQVQIGDRKTGHGLGLYLSKTIVEKHGGRLYATSDGKTGSAFHISLLLPGAN
jgi:signal transduction histidine kinase